MRASLVFAQSQLVSCKMRLTSLMCPHKWTFWRSNIALLTPFIDFREESPFMTGMVMV